MIGGIVGNKFLPEKLRQDIIPLMVSLCSWKAPRNMCDLLGVVRGRSRTPTTAFQQKVRRPIGVEVCISTASSLSSFAAGLSACVNPAACCTDKPIPKRSG
jgi:hypothetical protein